VQVGSGDAIGCQREGHGVRQFPGPGDDDVSALPCHGADPGQDSQQAITERLRWHEPATARSPAPSAQTYTEFGTWLDNKQPRGKRPAGVTPQTRGVSSAGLIGPPETVRARQASARRLTPPPRGSLPGSPDLS
jgi:hypothetical protein